MLDSQPYGEPREFEMGEALAFPDFSLTYQGEASSEGESGKTTASFTRRSFLVHGAGADQTLVVLCGQIPPQPLPFQIGPKTFVLLTYQMPDGARLYPHRLAVTGPAKP